MKPLSHYLNRISSIKIIPPTSLFDVEPNWEMLNEKRCPICANKLLFPRGKTIAICKGKRHGDKKAFIIKNQTLSKLKI